MFDLVAIKRLIGDFNLPELNWEFISAPNNSIYRMFLDFFNDLGLPQFVNSPTQNNNILDLILSNDPLLISMMQITCLVRPQHHHFQPEWYNITDMYRHMDTMISTGPTSLAETNIFLRYQYWTYAQYLENISCYSYSQERSNI